MNKILIVATLLLLLSGCIQPRVKSVEHLQSDYDRLKSLHTSLENDILHAQDPVKVENYLRAVENRMDQIENEILQRQLMER